MPGWDDDPAEFKWNQEVWYQTDKDGRLTAECACYVWPLSAMYHVPYCPYCDTAIVNKMRPGWETARPLHKEEAV